MRSALGQVLIFNPGGKVTGINDLSIQGQTWNVAFGDAQFSDIWGNPSAPSPTPTFWNNLSGAQTADSAITDALNAGGSPPLATVSGFSPFILYVIPVALVDSTTMTLLLSQRTSEWVHNGETSINPILAQPYAVFTSVPEVPQIGLAMGMAALGFTIWVRRSRIRECHAHPTAPGRE